MWLYILGVAALAGAAPYFFDGDMEWYASVASRDYIIFCVSLAALTLIRYDKPGVKAIWAIWTLWQFIIFVNTTLQLTFDLSADFWTVISWISTTVFVVWIFSRKTHSHPPRPLLDGHLYYILPAPHDLKGLFSCLFFRPYNGLKVYLNGKVYGYRKGKFCEIEGDRILKRLTDSRIIHIGQATGKHTDFLRGMIGSPWAPSKNCYHTFEQYFGPVRNYS